MFSVYALNNVASKYKIGLKGDVAKSTIRVGEFNTPLSIIDKASRPKIHKTAEHLINISNQFNLIDIFTSPQ